MVMVGTLGFRSVVTTYLSFCRLQVEVVLAALKTLVLLGLTMMLYLGVLLSTITTSLP